MNTVNVLSIACLVVSLISIAYSIVAYNTALRDHQYTKRKYTKIRNAVMELADKTDQHEMELIEARNTASRLNIASKNLANAKHAGEDKTA